MNKFTIRFSAILIIVFLLVGVTFPIVLNSNHLPAGGDPGGGGGGGDPSDWMYGQTVWDPGINQYTCACPSYIQDCYCG